MAKPPETVEEPSAPRPYYELVREWNRRETRLGSLDAFRGATIAAMLVVNQLPARSYAPLEHAEWNGWTHTDLIFPFFLFIVGVAMVYSFAARRQKGESGMTLLGHTIQRSAVIFLIGSALNLYWLPFRISQLGTRLETVRIPGVLQRIALAYLCAALLYVIAQAIGGGSAWRSSLAVALAVATLLWGYWALLMLVGQGDLSPAGNLGARIDRAVFGTAHMWLHRAWDPEGLLGTLPATATALLGVLTGEWLRSETSANKKVTGLLIAGVAGMAAGWAWGASFPINKNLWSSSYVLFSAGYALLVFAAFYWLCDVRGWRLWARPFEVFGVNPLFAFAASTALTKTLLLLHTHGTTTWAWLYERWSAKVLAEGPASALLFALAYMFAWMLVMAVFYWRGWRVKV